jgi:DNA processing protein
VYPAENAPLLERIVAEGGACISEMPLGWEPRGRDFPRRNRIVSGISYGVVVVEAARRSGSLITARFALEQGREVFAVPGSPMDPRAEGTNELIRAGATLCSAAEHIVAVLAPLVASESLPSREARESGVPADDEQSLPLWDELDLSGIPSSVAESAPAPPAEDTGAAGGPVDDRILVVRLLGPAPISIDEIVRQSGLPIRIVQTTLLELELAGRLERHGGNAVSIIMPP